MEKKKIEYSDDFETQDVKEIIYNYNELISKTIIDIPLLEQSFINRHDKKKIIISKTASQANYIFQGSPFTKNLKLRDAGGIELTLNFCQYTRNIL